MKSLKTTLAYAGLAGLCLTATLAARAENGKEAAAPAAWPMVVWPATMEPPFPRAQRDPRNNGLFAAAWSALFVKCAAVAGVDAVKLDVGPFYAAVVQESLASLAGCPVLESKVQADAPIPVDALALEKNGRKIVYLINKTDRPQPVVVAGLKGHAELWRFNESTAAVNSKAPAPITAPTSTSTSQETIAPDGSLRVELKPFEVCRITVTAK